MSKKESSLIEGIHYISFRKELFIRFTNQELYVYFDVPREIASAFQKADSLGRFFNEKIKYDFPFQHIVI